nr:uncharacterized protein LOC103235389 isoform X2 [Chlorocebus sabaeus]
MTSHEEAEVPPPPPWPAENAPVLGRQWPRVRGRRKGRCLLGNAVFPLHLPGVGTHPAHPTPRQWCHKPDHWDHSEKGNTEASHASKRPEATTFNSENKEWMRN